MSVHPLFPKQSQTSTPQAAIDVLRDRHTMLVDLGHSLADEDCFTRDELLIAGLHSIDAATVALNHADRRQLLVRASALVIAEIERMDRAAAQSIIVPLVVPA